jgi:hypothetical protein
LLRAEPGGQLAQVGSADTKSTYTMDKRDAYSLAGLWVGTWNVNTLPFCGCELVHPTNATQFCSCGCGLLVVGDNGCGFPLPCAAFQNYTRDATSSSAHPEWEPMVRERCGGEAPNLWRMTRNNEGDGGFNGVATDNQCYVCEYVTCRGKKCYTCCRCKVLPTQVCYCTRHHKSDTSLEVETVRTGRSDGAGDSV